MSTYSRQIKLALRLINAKGAAVVWKQDQPEQNNAEPWKTTANGAPVQFNVKILFIRQDSNLRRVLFALLKGTEVITGTSRGLMASVNFNPGMNDKVFLNGKQLNIVKFDPFAPDGIPIMYYLEFT